VTGFLILPMGPPCWLDPELDTAFRDQGWARERLRGRGVGAEALQGL
jgi:hypothetical protein